MSESESNDNGSFGVKLLLAVVIGFLLYYFILSSPQPVAASNQVAAANNQVAAANNQVAAANNQAVNMQQNAAATAGVAVADTTKGQGLPTYQASVSGPTYQASISLPSLPIGSAITCTGYNPKGNGAIYRYTGPNQMQWYPNPLIADSWDLNWGAAKSTDCTGFSLGPDLGVNGTVTYLRGGRGNKYCADDSDGVVRCNRDAVGPWEKFNKVQLADGSIAFVGGRAGKYCADDSDSIVRCNRDRIGPWEKFKMQVNAGITTLLGGRGNKYCTDDSDGIMRCNRDAIGAWERFTSGAA